MSPRLLIAAALAIPMLAHAQTPAERRATANKLLDALHAAPNEAVAGTLEEQIRQLWFNGSTPAVTLLMSRGLRELKAGDNTQAIDDFDSAVTLDPNLAEGYHQRAVAKYAAGDTPGAIRDLQAALQKEPRNFAAWQTLSRIAEAREDWKGAYQAWLKVLELDPKTPGGDDRLRELKRHALGENT